MSEASQRSQRNLSFSGARCAESKKKQKVIKNTNNTKPTKFSFSFFAMAKKRGPSSSNAVLAGGRASKKATVQHCPTGASSAVVIADGPEEQKSSSASADSSNEICVSLEPPKGFEEFTTSTGRTVYIRIPKFRKNVTKEELDEIYPEYWTEDSQHEVFCSCRACQIIRDWDKDEVPAFPYP